MPDPTAAEATASTALDQSGTGAGYTAVEPRECPPSARPDGSHTVMFDGDDPYTVCIYCGEMRDALSGRVIRAPYPTSMAETEEPVAPVLGEEAARAEIAAIIAMTDDGTDMLDEIMAGPVAALVRAAEQRGAEKERAEWHSALVKMDQTEHDSHLRAQVTVLAKWGGSR